MTTQLLSRGVCGRRISVVGTSGSGKTTTAAQIAQWLGIPHVEMDALHREPDWTEAPYTPTSPSCTCAHRARRARG